MPTVLEHTISDWYVLDHSGHVSGYASGLCTGGAGILAASITPLHSADMGTTANVATAVLLVLLQAYGRAIELEPRRLFSLVQSGLVLLALGDYKEAQGLLQSALEVDSQHVPALFAAAQLLLASAKFRIAQGTPGGLLHSCSCALLCCRCPCLFQHYVPAPTPDVSFRWYP